MVKVCQGPGCGQRYEAKTGKSKYCTPRCRIRAYQARKNGKPTSPLPPSAKPKAKRGRPPKPRLAAATRRELEAIRREGTSAGLAALILAERIDAGGAETGSALATMIAQHAAAMERARAAEAEADPVVKLQDEVTARRERNAGAN